MAERTCSIDGCGTKPYARGWCSKHYQRWWAHGDPHYAPEKRPEAPCSVDGCDRTTGIPGTARGWCRLHYGRWQRHGDHLWEPKRGRSRCTIDGCDMVVEGHGLCSKHYTRQHRYGTTGPTKPYIDLPDGIQWCSRCQQALAVSEFSGEGYTRCRTCVREATAEWKARNRELVRARQRAAYEANAEQRRADAAAYRAANPRKAAEASHRRRAQLRAARVETFSDAEIFDRDGWRCQLCKRRVDPGLRWPAPFSVSLDHIVPISRGGEHSRANAQTAHLRCNLKKHTGGTDQLRLIG